ncbi:hypothetical protein HDU98_004085 [Podochytrium sp. JEL0797]|nr:hypothetical protein HDU98_004085 [Podochytrium sp. JEL0797]
MQRSVPRLAWLGVGLSRRGLFTFGKSKDGQGGGFKQLLATHGPAALVTYAGLSGVSYVCFYVAVVASGVDPLQLMSALPFDVGHAANAPVPAGGGLEATFDAAMHAAEDAVHKGVENAERVVAVGKEGLDAMLHPHKESLGGDKNSIFNATTALVAWCVHELFLPLRLALTAYLTPRVSRWMRGGIVDRWLGSIMARFVKKPINTDTGKAQK